MGMAGGMGGGSLAILRGVGGFGSDFGVALFAELLRGLVALVSFHGMLSEAIGQATCGHGQPRFCR